MTSTADHQANAHDASLAGARTWFAEKGLSRPREGRILGGVVAAYTRRYDVDLLNEIRRDGKHGGLLVISGRDEGVPAGVERILIPAMGDAEDVDLLIPFIAVPQMFAFEGSISRGLSPDKPNTSGTVNRVVQGVRIHAVR